MPPEISFAFNEPEWVLPTYGFLLLALAFPAWKIWRIRALSESVKTFLLSAKGFPYLLAILLALLCLFWVTVDTYSSFWTLHITDAKHLTLDYWFPRRDRIVRPHDIREFALVTNQRHSKGEIVNKYWLLSLTIQESSKFTSIDIHHEDKAKRAIAALEHWTGRSHTHYLRDCLDPWGFVCSTSRVSKQ